MQPFLLSAWHLVFWVEGAPLWLCPLRRVHTTCTLVEAFGCPSPSLICVASQRLYLITIYKVSVGANSSTAITGKSVTLIPSNIHHWTQFPSGQYSLFCYLNFNGDASIQFLAVQIEECQHPLCRFVAYDGFTNLEVLAPHFVFFFSSWSGACSIPELSVWIQHAPWLGGIFVTPIMFYGVHW